MIRSAASKVMWVGRATVFLVGLAVILALLFGVASTAFAHKGEKGFFHLGHKNVSSKVSKLIKKGAGPALNLRVGSGPPLKVNSSTKVNNLNADKLDGNSEEDFYAAGSKVADSSHADQADNATNAQNAANAATLEGKDSTDFASATLFGSAVDGQISNNSGDCTMGEVRLFAGSRAPKNWLPAEGQLMVINQNTALFSLLENRYGGNGTTTFALPDLRGAEPKGAGPAAPYYVICVTGIFP